MTNKTETITVRCTQELKDRIKDAASLYGRSVSGYVLSQVAVRLLKDREKIDAFIVLRESKES